MAERESPPPTGMPPKNAAAMLDAPRPTNSRLASTRSRRFTANAWAIVMFCTMPMKARISAGVASACSDTMSGKTNRIGASSSLTDPTTATARCAPVGTSRLHKVTVAVASANTISGMTRTAKSTCDLRAPHAMASRARPKRDSSSHTSAVLDKPKVRGSVLGNCAHSAASVAALLALATGTPSKNLSWLMTINTAEPEMKPLTTGRLSNCDKNPRRNMPTVRIKTPDNSAKTAASAA